MIDPQELKKRIVFEDNHLIAINKRPSWLVQGDKTGDMPLLDALKDYIKKEYNKPRDIFLGSIHRLDRPVSGLVVFARTSKALERMNALFAGREVVKTYVAITEGKPPVSRRYSPAFPVERQSQQYCQRCESFPQRLEGCKGGYFGLCRS